MLITSPSVSLKLYTKEPEKIFTIPLAIWSFSGRFADCWHFFLHYFEDYGSTWEGGFWISLSACLKLYISHDMKKILKSFESFLDSVFMYFLILQLKQTTF
jgi:hypothetical protein